MTKFDPVQHLLLRDVAHKARLTPGSIRTSKRDCARRE